jgi:hypothetical protein
VNATTALLTSARGFRNLLGGIPQPDLMRHSAIALEEIAGALAEIAQLEAKAGADDETATGRWLAVEALKRRAADLFGDREHRDVCDHEGCAPECPCVYYMLLLPDRELRMNASKAVGMMQKAARAAKGVRGVIKEVYGSDASMYLGGGPGQGMGWTGLPEPEPDED